MDGAEVIRAQLPTLPDTPGVYRMLAADGSVLYVGKAKNLKRRVASYTRTDGLPNRTRRMVALTRAMEFVTTHTEAEALLLEANLIRSLLPPFNILVKDERSFSYIVIGKGQGGKGQGGKGHDFPRLMQHRGSADRRGGGGKGNRRDSDLFGPYASPHLVAITISTLQRAFQLRTCDDGVFASRTRPCLQYQIKRCSAPCVGRVGEEEYAEQVQGVRDVLSGRSAEVQAAFARRMTDSSDRLEYEDAARWRDRIRALTALQSRQDINLEGTLGDADVLALHREGAAACVQAFFFRGGRNQGTRAFFPRVDADEEPGAILAAFAAQLYADMPPPALLLLSEPATAPDLLAEALSLTAGRRVTVECPKRGPKQRAVEHALTNARDALGRRLAERSTQETLLAGVARLFALPASPKRIEIYDTSHIQGAFPVGAMVVAGPEGFQRNAYRRFHIRDPEAAGNDYAMLRETFTRRFARARTDDPDRSAGLWPDLILIDGGLGQLNAVRDELAMLRITDIPLVAIAKGPDRNAGRERLFRPGQPPLSLPPNDPVLHFLQRLRDEAHRTAIDGHRARRMKAMSHTRIDGIPGIGPTRKKALLHHFGSAAAVASAGLKDLEATPGISAAIAQKLYEYFHG
ncbi:excinuclease ABC subunit UvrC [Azospirillum picis]|uniref:UvrABC system protein C n=1 Tax=Azospirillum picis TaxID=488438 RepID=A0ABU0MP18_9PROT|nr:excinuclease ABC subunit UvrC [Azospirillum picis]MBP2301330.1 excinuclease ABC subunit C [Azospirillum picis]MDQ0535161.1 excinuclease ABC subunit C [Azospirillum picis]